MHHFFAYMARMKYIERWGLMRNTRQENIQEHSLQVAMIAHSLAIIKNKFFGGNLDENKIAVMAMYHEASEVITGDLATPIKYYNPEIKQAYKSLESLISKKLLNLLPEDLIPAYEPYFTAETGGEEWKIVKYADKICAYLKCLEETNSGNGEFKKAQKTIYEDIQNIKAPEVEYFMQTFVPSFWLTLDELEI